MDAIGNALPVITPSQPAPQAPPPAAAATAVPAPAQDIPAIDTAPSDLDLAKAEETRLHAVERAAQRAVESFVVSDKTFTIFKDVTGQYITRFFSLRDGRVTYIPEPELLRTSNPEIVALVNIKA